MLGFPFHNPVKKNISDYIKLSNDISMQKLKDRYSVKSPYKINYDLTLSNCKNTNKNSNFNENVENVVTKYLDANVIVSLVETIVLFAITFVIYKKFN